MSVFKIKIEKIVSGGHGFSVLDNGMVVFTDFVLPKEEVEVKLVQSKKGYAWGRLQQILTPSPLRITPPCEFFGTCGGCQFQMVDYPFQLNLKQEIIHEAMIRIAKLDIPVNLVVPSSKPFNYRNKGSFQLFGDKQIGYCKPGRNIPFAIQNCPIMEEAINDKIRDFLSNPQEREILDTKKKALTIRSNVLGETINSTIKRHAFTDKVAGLEFFIDVDTFFQVNRFIIPLWLQYIEKLILKHKVGQGLLDLYCGVGIISQYLAKHFEKVVGIEVNKRLVENGNKVLVKNNISNAQFIVADAANLNQYSFSYDTVIINPPRKGIDLSMAQALIEHSPKVIIYSSCNPDTFARDIAILHQGGYHIDEVQPFDMFPQTQHSEVVGVLYKK